MPENEKLKVGRIVSLLKISSLENSLASFVHPDFIGRVGGSNPSPPTPQLPIVPMGWSEAPQNQSDFTLSLSSNVIFTRLSRLLRSLGTIHSL